MLHFFCYITDQGLGEVCGNPQDAITSSSARPAVVAVFGGYQSVSADTMVMVSY